MALEYYNLVISSLLLSLSQRSHFRSEHSRVMVGTPSQASFEYERGDCALHRMLHASHKLALRANAEYGHRYIALQESYFNEVLRLVSEWFCWLLRAI